VEILILCPDRLLPEFLRRPLEAAGHQVELIHRADALEGRLADGRISLVLAPARLGPLEGLDLARRVRTAGEAAVILFGPEEPPRGAARSAGQRLVDGFLRVPFSAAEVTELVGVATRERRLVLLADDSELVHRHLVPPLTEAGYDLLSAYDGNEALELAFKHLPDLVVTDVEMPGADGFMVCQTLKEDPRTEHLPVVIASALGEAESLEQGFDAGADDYLVKPVVPEELISRIRVLIAGVELSGRERILVVDDSPAVRHLITDTLRRQGFEVHAAEDGAAGLERAIELMQAEDPAQRVQLVITDYDMPVMNGFEFVHALKQRPQTREVPVMMLTARESRRDQAQMRAVGLTAYLVKPFSMDKCVAMVERILAERRLMAYKAASALYLSEGAVKAAEAQALSGRIGEIRAEELHLSVLFSDICGFTTMSAALTAGEVVSILNTYFDAMCPVLREHGGDIDKFIGDAIMAVFPERPDGEPPPLRAVKAALQMQRANEALFEGADPRLQMRIGVNTGPVVRGDIGSRHAPGGRDYTVIGDTVNRAQRFESNAPVGGILVSASTYEAIADQVEVERAQELTLKGVPEPVTAYVVKGLK
jgi:DNA-binding response OmpR family regulator